MANAGLSVKERLALLQNNNNNNNNTTSNKSAGGPGHKLTPALTPKPSSSDAKPPGITSSKPVTPTKPAGAAANSHKPISPHSNKPETPAKPATPADKPAISPDKPATASKPMPSGTKPVAFGNKPALASKPWSAVKPFTPTTGTSDSSNANGSDSPLTAKLRPVGTTPGKGAPSASKPATSPSGDKGEEGEKPAESTKPPASQDTGGPESSKSSGEPMREKPASIFTPLKPLSVQERLAALRQKSCEAETTEPKPKQHHSVSPTSQSSPALKPSPRFPRSPSPVSGVSPPADTPVNSAASEFSGIKRADIAKSLTQAADRVLRNKTAEDGAHTRRSQLFQRRSDGKKFRKLDAASVISSDPAPAKPGRLDNVDLKPFLHAYAAAKEEKLKADAGKSDAGEGEEEGEMEELYVEAESTSVPIRGRKGSVKRATSSRVSQIPEFTEEEEEEELGLYTDGSSGGAVPPVPSEPEETYDDCESALEVRNQEPLLEEPDEIYEPLDDEPPVGLRTTEADIPPPLPSPNNAEDRRERENNEKEEAARKKEKAKEETNKKEEKERKKKEEDMKKMRRKFGLNDGDEKVGDGVVKSDAGGWVFSKDLAVVKGETIAILRMDGNPAGKWLVQNEQGKIGFVNSNNIEISTPTIRHLMAGVKHETGTKQDTAAMEEPEDMYEALPEGEFEEIYEEL